MRKDAESEYYDALEYLTSLFTAKPKHAPKTAQEKAAHNAKKHAAKKAAKVLARQEKEEKEALRMEKDHLRVEKERVQQEKKRVQDQKEKLALPQQLPQQVPAPVPAEIAPRSTAKTLRQLEKELSITQATSWHELRAQNATADWGAWEDDEELEWMDDKDAVAAAAEEHVHLAYAKVGETLPLSASDVMEEEQEMKKLSVEEKWARIEGASWR